MDRRHLSPERFAPSGHLASRHLALATAVQEVKRLRKRPSPERLETMSTPWRPWRAVAARLFWHAYLCKRGQRSATISL